MRGLRPVTPPLVGRIRIQLRTGSYIGRRTVLSIGVPSGGKDTCPRNRRAWQRYPAGEGAKGYRYYDWAWLAIDPGRPGHRYLLIRRNRHTRELAFYRCYSPRQVPLPILVKVAGIRWTTAENFQAGQRLTGLDEHQVRRWDSWYRWASWYLWTTLAMLAPAFLTIAAATGPASAPPDDQIPLTRNEIAALFSTLIIDPVKKPGTGCQPGGGATSTARKPATTSGKPANHEDYEVPLEY